MTAKRLVVAALVVGGIVFVSARSCRSPAAPDERFAEHISQLCGIARKNVDKPVPGVRELGNYLGKHTGHMMKDLADTLAMIERIDDDAKHDARARKTRDRWSEAGCAEDWMDFLDAIENDEKAAALLEYRIERISRTLDIIMSGQPNVSKQLDRRTLRDLMPRP
jgi:hypothetical protein